MKVNQGWKTAPPGSANELWIVQPMSREVPVAAWVRPAERQLRCFVLPIGLTSARSLTRIGSIAGVVELVDALDSKSSIPCGCASSILASGTRSRGPSCWRGPFSCGPDGPTGHRGLREGGRRSRRAPAAAGRTGSRFLLTRKAPCGYWVGFWAASIAGRHACQRACAARLHPGSGFE